MCRPLVHQAVMHLPCIFVAGIFRLQELPGEPAGKLCYGRSNRSRRCHAVPPGSFRIVCATTAFSTA
jgi:hypothetical protein